MQKANLTPLRRSRRTAQIHEEKTSTYDIFKQLESIRQLIGRGAWWGTVTAQLLATNTAENPAGNIDYTF
jgi:hypothetical protein